MKKTAAMIVALLLICAPCFAACEYTGRAENVGTNERGVTFTVVVIDCEAKEVLRRDQFVSTGSMTGVVAVDAVKKQVELMTQEIWAHVEGAKEAISEKTEIEGYSAKCSSFVALDKRAKP